jgi:hypothetical protein
MAVGAALALTAIAIYAISSVQRAASEPLRRVPPVTPTASYEIDFRRDGGAMRPLRVGRSGEGCEQISQSHRLYETCLVAVNLDPAVIGGSALGKLNDEDTPAFDALVWRARLGADASVCDRGGLLGEYLARCRHHAETRDYAVSDRGITVSVPLPSKS